MSTLLEFGGIDAEGWLTIEATNPDTARDTSALDRIGNMVTVYERIGVNIRGLQIVVSEFPSAQRALEHPAGKAYADTIYILALNNSKQYPVVFVRGNEEQIRVCEHQWVDTGMSFTFCKHCNISGRRTINGITH